MLADQGDMQIVFKTNGKEAKANYIVLAASLPSASIIFKSLSNIYDVTFKLKVVNFFRKKLHHNPSHPDPGRTEKININFYFCTSLWCL